LHSMDYCYQPVHTTLLNHRDPLVITEAKVAQMKNGQPDVPQAVLDFAARILPAHWKTDRDFQIKATVDKPKNLHVQIAETGYHMLIEAPILPGFCKLTSFYMREEGKSRTCIFNEPCETESKLVDIMGKALERIEKWEKVFVPELQRMGFAAKSAASYSAVLVDNVQLVVNPSLFPPSQCLIRRYVPAGVTPRCRKPVTTSSYYEKAREKLFGTRRPSLPAFMERPPLPCDGSTGDLDDFVASIVKMFEDPYVEICDCCY